MLKKVAILAMGLMLITTSAVPTYAASKYSEDMPLKAVKTEKLTVSNGDVHTYITADNGCRYMMYHSCLDGMTPSTPTNHEGTITLDGVQYSLSNYSNAKGTQASSVIKPLGGSTPAPAALATDAKAPAAPAPAKLATPSPAKPTPSQSKPANSSTLAPATPSPSQSKPANSSTLAPATPSKTPVALKSISLNKSTVSLEKGSTATLKVSYAPSNTTASKTVTWTSSNSKVCTVSSGRVVAKQPGTATVTAKVGSKTAKCTVYVNGYADVSAMYQKVNNFRTTKGIWYYNSNNTSKTYFNTNSKNTLKPLKRSAALEKTAQVRAKELATKFSHTRPNGQKCFTAFPVSKGCKGENIAYGYDEMYQVMDAWKEKDEKYSGQGHRRNMLDKDFNYIGVACYVKNGTCYWVQDFSEK